jgi:hypothetical protein
MRVVERSESTVRYQLLSCSMTKLLRAVYRKSFTVSRYIGARGGLIIPKLPDPDKVGTGEWIDAYLSHQKQIGWSSRC